MVSVHRVLTGFIVFSVAFGAGFLWESDCPARSHKSTGGRRSLAHAQKREAPDSLHLRKRSHVGKARKRKPTVDVDRASTHVAEVAKEVWAVVPDSSLPTSGNAEGSQTTLRSRPNTLQMLEHVAHDRALSEPVGTPMTGFAQQAEGHAQTVHLEAGRCYAVLGTGEATMTQLSLSLWNPDATRFQTVIGRQTPFAAFRAMQTGPHKLVARPAQGFGTFAAGLYVYPCPEDAHPRSSG